VEEEAFRAKIYIQMANRVKIRKHLETSEENHISVSWTFQQIKEIN